MQSALLSYGASVAYQGAKPTRPNSENYAYTFKKWNPSITAAVADVEYTPVFDSIKIYTITIDDGTSKTDTAASIQFILPDAPAKDGYEFVGWYNGDEKLGMPGDTIQIVEGLRISAKWEKTDAIHFSAHPRFNLHVQNRTLQIQNARIGAAFNLLDLQGRVLHRGVVNAPVFSLEMPNAGAYIVRVGKEIQKIRVK
ncbi:InlB B-repeat-containing protein [Fibrobacter intestinalis]|uniref:Listeria/Bacterioides repeat-containing protein n=1 Tax=Fibrobacter intestinalis TaxID=28122 RepID=A0A1T4M5I9_9BACT|nr:MULTISPECIES: InlB B-repeat-containing protein [Fibrobacter]PBC73452.1 putative repeat protein (TIGR02543 family) [Fibrobacter sp. NR9]SJZ62116.1 Listeria/Bacterioides repeat-containing protein [Fibrobacter intestinalis]